MFQRKWDIVGINSLHLCPIADRWGNDSTLCKHSIRLFP